VTLPAPPIRCFALTLCALQINCFYDYDYDCYRNIMIQEAQLSQRDRATLRVIEYFAKSVRSLKIIRNDTVEYGVCKSPLVLH